MSEIKVTLICGGRGSAQLIRSLDQNRLVDLTLLVNAYDDGLSTGVLRQLIPGMLGPSDFRKNMSHSMSYHRNPYNLLLNLFEYRVKEFDEKFISKFLIYKDLSLIDVRFKSLNKVISRDQYNLILNAIYTICKHLEQFSREKYSFEMSVGNLVFSGIYLNNSHNFNKTINIYYNLLQIKSKIFNVSDGNNLNLIALRQSGKIEMSESNIVNLDIDDNILDLALIKTAELTTVGEKNDFPKSETVDYSKYISKEAIKTISESDIIIYGSGTLHSSIFPSLMILNKYIKNNKNAIKFLINNLDKDNDVKYMTNSDIFNQFLHYLKDPGNVNQTIDFILQDDSSESINFDSAYANLKVVKRDYRSKVLTSKHNGYFLSEQLIKSYDKSLIKEVYLSILISSSEESGALQTLQSDLEDLSFILKCNVNVELKYFQDERDLFNQIFLLVKSNPDNFSFFSIINNNMNFNVVDFFNGLKTAFENVDLSANIDFSRSTLLDIDKNNLQQLYRFKKSKIIISKIISFLISIILALRFNRFISDPLCDLKIYNVKSIENINTDFHKFKTYFDLWIMLLKSKANFIESPIEFFESSKDKYIKSKIRKTLSLLVSILRNR